MGGFKRIGDNFSSVFYDHTGLIANIPTLGYGLFGGHFSTGGELGNPTLNEATYYWGRPDGSSGMEIHPRNFSAAGFALPNCFVGDGRVTYEVDGLRQVIVPNLDLTYAVTRGDFTSDATFFGNPWLASAAGTFTRLSADLNAAVPRSDLIGLTLYERDQDFLGTAPWPNAGEHSLTITPHAITTGGAVTTGTPFPVAYQAPDPAAWFFWDASLWVEPSTTP